MSIYSFSQIGVYQQCPKKYQYQYVDKLEKDFQSSLDLTLGTSVHGSLEWLYQQVDIFRLPSKEEVLAKFHELRDKEIADAGDKLFYKGEQTTEDYIRRGEHYLDDYYEKNSPFNQQKLIGTEIMLTFDLNADLENGNKKSFRGIIDRLDKQPGDIFVINDYKTNKNLPTEDDTKYKEQLTLYGLGIKQKYGQYLKGIKARLHYLHFDFEEPIEWTITDDVLNPIVEKYSKLIDEIELAKAKYAETFYSDKGVFPVKANNFCKFCEYQNFCPLFIHITYGNDTISGGTLGESTIKNLVDQYVKISKEVNNLTEEKKLIKDVLVEYAKDKDFEQLFGNESIVGLSKSINYMIKDRNTFIDYLKRMGIFDKAIDIPYYKINNLIKDGDLSEDVINEYLDGKESWKILPKNKT